ncbi:MAG: hypothetical protein AUJ55_05510 [Proteobacteria bacterium CG1_02_64_396]|nr:MAG: hypothetical protein AUJ55_05510 [Proteobacteria bacterium CG1_02_64_396]
MNAEAAKPDFTEIATTNDGRDITRGYVDALPYLSSSDSVLRTQGGDLTVYEELLRDDKIGSTLQQRRLALIGKEWDIEPGGSRALDKAAAKHLKEQISALQWDQKCGKMLYGLMYGYGVAECLWRRDGRFVTLDDIKVRKARRFAWSPRGELLLRTTSNPMGELMPPRKFWTWEVGSDNDDEPCGLGLGHWLYWPAFFKRNGMKLWLQFLDKFGMPTGVGKYKGTPTPEEKARMLAALAAIQSDSGILIPDGMLIELLEAARSGTADYATLYDRMDAAIARVVLGHEGSSSSTPGKLGGEDNAMEVRDDLVQADADLLDGSFNATVAKWLTEWNFPGAATPKLFRRIGDQVDAKAESEVAKNLVQVGFRPSLKHVHDTFGGEWEVVENTPAPPPAPLVPAQPDGGGDPGAPAFAEGQDDPIAGIDAALQEQINTQIQAWFEKEIDDVLDHAESLDQIPTLLLARLPNMSVEGMSQAMAEAMAAAHLRGRSDILEQAGGG